jgi:hypothetical protein
MDDGVKVTKADGYGADLPEIPAVGVHPRSSAVEKGVPRGQFPAFFKRPIGRLAFPALRPLSFPLRVGPARKISAHPALAYLRGENAPRTGGAGPRPGPLVPHAEYRVGGPRPKRDESRLGRHPVSQGTFAGLEEAVQGSGVACGLLPCSGRVGWSACAGEKRRFRAGMMKRPALGGRGLVGSRGVLRNRSPEASARLEYRLQADRRVLRRSRHHRV